RKRARRPCPAAAPASTSDNAARYLQHELPDEVLLTVFSYVLERDLCRVSQVCKRFQSICNDTELWKNLYQGVYEYDLPLFSSGPQRFEFVQPEDSDHDNPWKESFKQMYRGIHVRPGYQESHHDRGTGRSVTYFDTIETAFNY